VALHLANQALVSLKRDCHAEAVVFTSLEHRANRAFAVSAVAGNFGKPVTHTADGNAGGKRRIEAFRRPGAATAPTYRQIFLQALWCAPSDCQIPA
jgi:hypothetical protein